MIHAVIIKCCLNTVEWV